ncbi:MAG: TlpA family protein disulfide reductase, partial [Gemmatimonadales bacterium]
LDILDPATGRVLRTYDDIPAHGTVAVSRTAQIRTPDPDQLLARARPREREPFAPAFSLPNLAGDTLRLADVKGKVTLVNFWASWCDPCREEFPHMIALYREVPRTDFEIVAISDDVDRAAMRRFVREFDPPFPVLVGGGRMREVYHYRGLPYSVLLDRDGRIVERIFGFGGEAEFHRLHGRILAEVGAR